MSSPRKKVKKEEKELKEKDKENPTDVGRGSPGHRKKFDFATNCYDLGLSIWIMCIYGEIHQRLY
jgi:hypothetical protein